MLIKHNQKRKAERIFQNATEIMSYNLGNGFRGVPLGENGREWLAKEWRFSFARLTEDVPCHYTLHMHSNLWYVFTSISEVKL